MEKKSPLRSLLSVLLLAGTAAGLFNTYSNNADVVRMAEALACEKPGCTTRMVREQRGPIGQSFTFQTTAAGKQGVADIECKRTYYLVGAYACTRGAS